MNRNSVNIFMLQFNPQASCAWNLHSMCSKKIPSP